MSEPSPGTVDKWIRAYERMVERVHAAIRHAGEGRLPSMQRHFDEARDKAVELGELTREEADRIAAYVQRDVEDAAQFLERGSENLSSWLRFDLQLIEERLWEMFAQVADRTSLELAALREQANAPPATPAYHTGEITGPGTLQCASCAKRLHFHTTARIPPCPRCHRTAFERAEEP